MKRIPIILHNLVVISSIVPYTLAVINVTLTGTTTQHVCKGEDIDFKWSYDDTDPDKDFIKTIHWSKDPSGYLIMQYETATTDLSITTSPNDYTGRVERTTAAGSNDIGMRLKQAGSTSVDDEGKYYVSLIVDKPGGDGDDYFVPYRDPQGVQVYVCIGVDDTFPLPSLSLTYDENTNEINCSGPSSLGDTTFAIFDPSMNPVVDSTTDTTISKEISSDMKTGNYRCKTYCTQQGYGDTPQGTCLPTDATLDLVVPGWSEWGPCDVASSSRTRTCTNPAPGTNGPQTCTGVSTKSEICPTTPPLGSTTTTTTTTTTSQPGPAGCDPPCAHGRTCIQKANGFVCVCVAPRGGPSCMDFPDARVIGNCSTGTNGIIKRSINDNAIMTHIFTIPKETPCTTRFQNIPNVCFNVTVEFLPLVTNARRKRRSAADMASSPGLSFNIIDQDNFDMVYFRTDDVNCFEVGSFVKGNFIASGEDYDCGEFRITTDWFNVELHVCNDTVLLKLNGGAIETALDVKHPFKPSLGLVQGPPYNDECSQDCRFQFTNLSVYPAFDPQTGIVEMDGFCSSPIRGGCLALIIVCVIIYLIIVVYVLILICYTFVKGVDDSIPIWLKIILIVVVIILPVIGAIIVVVYVYIKHCGKNKEEHSGKYFVFKCPCGMEANGRQSPLPPKPNGVSPSTENSTQVPPIYAAMFSDSKSTKKRALPPLNGDAANTDSSKLSDDKKKKKKNKKNKKEERDEKEAKVEI